MSLYLLFNVCVLVLVCKLIVELIWEQPDEEVSRSITKDF